MMVFVGLGGNGARSSTVPPYDNIWPHSSSLEFYYTDTETGQKGYVSDDQLKDLEGRPLYYTSASRTTMTTATTAFPVYVRVGPYNVNPEYGDRARERDLARVRPLARPAGLLLGRRRETYGTGT